MNSILSIIEQFENEIEKVLKGEFKETTSNGIVSPHEVDRILKDTFGLVRGEFDSNGWDWDFWMNYSKDGKTYCLSGNGWFNKGLTFSLNEDE